MFIACIFGAVGLAFVTQPTTPMPLVICVLVVSVIAFAWLPRMDVCPKCGKSIRMLPNEGTLGWPRLSTEVKCCPYCGDDYSVRQNQARDTEAG